MDPRRTCAAQIAGLIAVALWLSCATFAFADQPAKNADNGQAQAGAATPADSNGGGGGSGSTATSGPGNSSQGCDGSHNSDTGHGANHSGPYDNTCDGSPSGNGNGNGNATGKPCAGCVGNADDKNPKGQYPNGTDRNAGYECDRNHGIGRTNPAHTGCTSTTTPPTGCTTPGGCRPGNECTTPGGCAPGQETPPPGQTVTPTTPSGPPASQTVLAERQTGPAATPKQIVLGARRSGGAKAPKPAKPPVAATQAHGAPSASHGALPFTGGNEVAALAAGLLMLLMGVALQWAIGPSPTGRRS